MANSPIMLFFILCCLALITPAACSNNQTDSLALLAIKAAIHDPHAALNSWNETTNFCSWTGIQCGNHHPDRVVAIYLRSQDLVGSLSPHIGNLSFLRRINLKNNSFHGQIPQEITLLRRLEALEISNNSFVGQIPRNMSQCKNLFYLNLIDNKLSGAIPHDLGSLYKLQALGLGLNTFFGPIPSFIGNCTSLTRLSLRACDFKGQIPSSFAQLQSLTFLSLADNSLTGSIPSGLFNISTLVVFEVSRNQLQGIIPSSIGLTLPNLEFLTLARNQFSGAVPVSLSNATSLQKILFTRNNFTGLFPRLGKLSNLLALSFAANPIQDDISFISSLTNCTYLEVLEVGDNLLTGSLPNSIVNLSTYLDVFVIDYTDIHGSIPSGIGNLVGLSRFSLTYNNLEGPIPLGIGRLTNLGLLDLTGNGFTNEMPSSLGNLTLLNYLYLARNNFSGELPKSLTTCTSLLELDLSLNNLNGPIPPGVMNLSSISISLRLSHNAFTGPIPSEVGFLKNLANLDLSNNRLSGLIPSSLSTCTILERLHLEDNLFEGQIPLGLGALMGLVELDLSRNNLSGSIPSFLAKMHLNKLNLSSNSLEGEVPVLGVFGNATAISLEGNKELCGGIPKLKLPPCAPSSYSSKKNKLILLKILIPAVVAVFICLIIFLYKLRTPKKDLFSLPSLFSTQFLRVSYADLLKATNGFSETNLVGVGRFGSVYKGILDDGQTLVAVKVLNLVVKGASKSFIAECKALRGIRHRNLVKILSVCESIDFQGNDFKSLVYEFKANGNLEKWLHHNREQGEEETWKLGLIQRLNVAIDIAHALDYLHCGTDSIVVHGDLKPSNILLDDDMTAYLGDFGLAKIISTILPPQGTSSSVGIKGTIGYVAPEYGVSELVSTAGDVYSYGILLLEMFTNRRPTDDLFADQLNLHNFVNATLPDKLMEIVDPHIQIRYGMKNHDKVKDFVVSVLSIGVSCSKEMPKDRMLITDVVNRLHRIRDCYCAYIA